jgi:manganese transport protein
MPRFGPGLLVAAAFVGPGTVTTASVAGAEFGFALLWALLFSVLATVLLQEMAARLGLVTGHNLAEVLGTTFTHPAARVAVILPVIAAIAFGNAAFETGNIVGAALALSLLTELPLAIWSLGVGAVAFALLASGVYRVVERTLIVLVAVMSAVFLLTMIIVKPDIPVLLQGLLWPSIPADSLLTIIALIGTTVVPYNLFLHSGVVHEKWKDVPVERAIKECRVDTIASISLGGLVTLAVLTTAATVLFARGVQISSAAAMTQQLEPLLGAGAKYFFAIGLFCAGITSAVTAPLAAAYTVAGLFGWRRDLRNRRFQAVWAVIILIGTLFAVLGTRPVTAIIFAQAANGLLLPVVAVLLLVVMNRGEILGTYRNRSLGNVLGAVLILTVTGLAIAQLSRITGIVG